MFKTLYSKLVLILLLLLLPLAFAFFASSRYSSQLYQQEVAQKLNRDLAQHIAADGKLLRAGKFDTVALEQLFHTLMVVNPSIELYGLDTIGNIQAFSAPPGHVKRRYVTLAPIQAFLTEQDPLPILGDDPRDNERQKVFSAAPLLENGQLTGYLYIILASESYDGVAALLNSSHSFRQGVTIFAASSGFALVAGLLLFAFLTRRLRSLTTEMDSFAASNFSRALTVPTTTENVNGDEFARLQHTFHAMADRISEQLDTLRKTDTTRREMIANVSHDLRTPLASLIGYLETIVLKRDTLSPQEQDEFLTIATKHGRHLGKLIEELFELAKLDSLETLLHCEPVALAELLQDVAQKFALPAAQRQIQIECHCERNLPYVAADLGLVVRAVENLIDNALRYTPAGGRITIDLALETGHIIVRVSDTGRGIPAADLPRIFERFYRVEKSRQDDGGSGLGLAIVKRIVELHGSTIQAVSRLNAGTTFSFRLPVAA